MDSLLTSPNGNGHNGSTQEQSYENVRGRRITSATLPPGGGRKPFIGHIATFAQMFQAQFSKLYLNPDEAYRQSKKHASSMRRDPVVMEPLRARQLATALLDFQIQPEDENDPIQKKVCEELACIIRKTPDFLKLKMCLLEAIWFGRYAVNMYGYHWDENNVTNLVPGAWLPIHGDKLKFEHDTGNLGIMVGTQRTIGNIPEGCEWRLDTESKVIMVPNETYRRAMIVHKHEIEDGEFFEGESAGSIHGVGLRTRVYWPWFFKQKLLQWLMTFCERQALGITVWYYEAGNEQSEIQVRRAAEENNENLNIFFPRSVEGEQGAGIERLDVATGGAEMFKSVADEYWGDQIKRMIIGQTLTSQTGATGLGSEVAKQHRDTFENLIKYDSINLGETLTREMLIKPICEYGFPGMTWRPRLEFVIQPEDPKEVMEAAKMFIDMGGEASEDEIRELAGLRKPLDGEKVLGGSTAVPPGGPGGAPGLPPQLQGLGGEDGQLLDVPDGEYDLVPRGGEAEEFARKPAKGQTAFEWNEADHPRDDDGKFAEKEGGGNKSSGKPKTGKSKGHVGFSGDFEYFKGDGGELYSAKKSEAIMPDGYRTGRWEAPPHLADKRIGMLTMDPDEPAEDDTPFALQNTPDKPAPKEPEKPTPADQSHLFAGSDWKPGQEELFDPEAGDSDDPPATRLGKLVASHKGMPPVADAFRTFGGESMTPDEAEQFMVAAGMDELNAADTVADVKLDDAGRMRVTKAIVMFKHRMHLLDVDAAVSENLEAAKGAKVAVFAGDDGPDAKFMVHKSTRVPGKFQVTRMRTLDGVKDTPIGHTDHDSWEEAIRSVSGGHPKGPYYNDGDGSYRLVQRFERDFEPWQFEAGNWITIGSNKSAPKGQKGGTPVMVKDGKIVKGPAALQQKSIGNLKGPAEDDRSKKKEQVDAKSYEHARRRKEARKLGIHPDDVQGVYDDLKAADDHETTLHNQLVRTAYKALGVDRRHKVLHGEDWASIPGADQVAREIANSEEYQFLLNARDEQDAAEKLYERMAEGIRQPKGDKELWNEALELAVHHQSTPARKDEDAVPFEKLVGGLGDDRPDDDFDIEQLEAGIAVEMEHTDDPEKAKEIAKDHLAEDAEYYRKLRQIEPERNEMAAACPSCGGSESGPIEDDPDGHDTECVSCGHRYASPVCDPDERGSECFQPERHSRSVTFESFWGIA